MLVMVATEMVAGEQRQERTDGRGSGTVTINKGLLVVPMRQISAEEEQLP